MTKPRQKPITLRSRDRDTLDKHKKKYESTRGSTDWGEFLRTVVLLGLAAAGIYAIVKATQRSEGSVNVECTCGERFVLALTPDVDRAVSVICPACGRELVVDLQAVRQSM